MIDSQRHYRSSVRVQRQFLRSMMIVLFAGLVGCGSNQPAHEGKSIAQLRAMLHDPKPEMQIQGAIGLGKQKAEAKIAVPDLVALLDSSVLTVRQNAINALGEIGPEANEAVNRLMELLTDREWTIRRQATVALGEIGDPKSIPAIQKLSKDSDTLVRKTANETLQKLRKK